MNTKERFSAFHERNPHVYAHFARLAKELKSRGRTKCSIWLLANVVRWTVWMERDPNEKFKISNDYLCYYSRLLMDKEPELVGFFETKALKEDYA